MNSYSRLIICQALFIQESIFIDSQCGHVARFCYSNLVADIITKLNLLHETSLEYEVDMLKCIEYNNPKMWKWYTDIISSLTDANIIRSQEDILGFGVQHPNTFNGFIYVEVIHHEHQVQYPCNF